MDALMNDIIIDMRRGYAPTYRGHRWSQQHYAAVEGMALALDAAFDYAKWLQFPEVDSRLREAQALQKQLDGAESKASEGDGPGAQSLPGDEGGDEYENLIDVTVDLL